MSEHPDHREILKAVATGDVATPASTAPMGPPPPPPPPPASDVRLKRDIVRVGQLENGIPLYRFRYLWSDAVHVGVMVQDVRPLVPEAVIDDDSGFMRVDYQRLGTRMMSWDEWQSSPESRLPAAS
jgi:hypothetical protein